MKRFIAIIIFIICLNLALPSFASDANAKTYCDSGLTKIELKDYKGALADYTKAIELNPNNYEGYAGRGVSKFELKNYADSIDDCTKAIEINPNDGWVYLYRSNSKKELQDFKGAAQDRKKFDELTKYFKSYIKKITKIAKSNWKPPIKERGTSIIARCTLNKKGEISNIKIIKSSSVIQNDESAINALKKSSPLPQLPTEYKGSSVDIDFHFDIKPKWGT